MTCKFTRISQSSRDN